MTLKYATSLAALAMTLSACNSLWSPPRGTLPETLVPEQAKPVDRYAEVMLGEPDLSLPAFADPALDALRSAKLTRFSGEPEFFSWLGHVKDASEARGGMWWGGKDYPAPVAMMAAPEPESAAQAAPAADAAMEAITVTGSVADSSPDNPEITNNQKSGVDEGGIVKQIGNFLVVLQDGRLFITDLMPGGEPGLKLADRANVYRSTNEDTWYDEMLVAGRTILVTGYSYREDATEFTVLTLSDDGKATRQATFYISSDDYYSGSNYATRMIDGKLVIHTPIYVAGRGWWDAFDPPQIREWRREGPEGEREDDDVSEGRPLFRAGDIWMPVQRLLYPVIHTVTVCDISGVTDASAPACTATAIAGSSEHEFLVTQDAFWLWLSPNGQERARDADGDAGDECAERIEHAPIADVADSVLVKLPIDGAEPSVLNVRGEPQNQFSMDMDAGIFRAVLDWHSEVCDDHGYGDPAVLTYFDAPLSALTGELSDAAGGRYVPLPSPGTSDYEARFTDTHLVYGARDGWGSWAPEESEEAREDGRAIIVPVANPSWPVTVNVPHDVIRAERAGPYMALTGYRDYRGLSVSLIDLRTRPRLASTFTLENRFESENRSHAFSSRIGADGEGLIGLPTVQRSEESERWWWWSESSDLTYLHTDARGTLSGAGELVATRTDPNAESPVGYECEVSCVDWYGNARPIFSGGRILALMNSELVEGVMEDGAVREVRRIDLTAPQK